MKRDFALLDRLNISVVEPNNSIYVKCTKTDNVDIVINNLYELFKSSDVSRHSIALDQMEGAIELVKSFGITDLTIIEFYIWLD